MAKISSYTVVGSPSLSDILIGSDSNDSNATKNFSIGGMLGLANDPSVLTGFVPYIGATQDVDLGSFGITADFGDFSNLSINGANAFAYGQFYSTVTQQATIINNPFAVDFPSAIISDGIYITSSNKINVNNSGVYMITVTARVDNASGGGDAQISFWADKSGSNIPFSRQVFVVANTHIEEITYNFLTRIAPTESVTIYWSTSNLNAKLIASVAGGPYPASPSAMIQIYKVGY